MPVASGIGAAIGPAIVARLLQLRTADVADLSITALSTYELATAPPGGGLSVTCLHATQNRSLRNLPRAGAVASLVFDLQFLIAAWPSGAAEEETAIRWAMEAIWRNPVLPGASSVRLVLADLDREAMASVWRAFGQPARLGVVLIAQGVTASGL